MASALHPYYPLELELPGFVPMGVSFRYVLGVFSFCTVVVFSATWIVSGRRPKVTTVERLMACWFAICGIIHLVVEGWVVLKSDFFKDTTGNYLSDTWKEYAKADSRYISRDPFVVSMEAVTAFAWGPACIALVHGILTHKPWRYTLMLIVSGGQIYGDVLYFATCYAEGFVHSRPEWLYFWFYFAIVNAIWIVVPGSIMVHASNKVNRAVSTAAAIGPIKAA